MASRLKADLRVAHVVYAPGILWSMSIPGSASAIDQIEADAQDVGEVILAKAAKFAKDSGVTSVKSEVVTDLVAPAQGIVQLAERTGVDLVVLGTRGNGGFKKLLLGSVANSLLHYAHCSVLVTK